MNSQKRLIAVFRTFIEKSLLPQIRRVDGNLQDWNRFNALISNQIININQLQNYVDAIPSYSVGILSERKDISLSSRKKEDNNNYLDNSQPFSGNRTFGGERSKNLMTGLQTQQIKYESKGETMKQITHIKGASQGKQYSRDDSFRKNPTVSLQTISGSPTSINQPNLIMNSLDRLIKLMIQNQQKIDLIQGKSL